VFCKTRKGKVSLRKDSDNKTTRYILEVGVLNTEIVGSSASISGVNYDSLTFLELKATALYFF